MTKKGPRVRSALRNLSPMLERRAVVAGSIRWHYAAHEHDRRPQWEGKHSDSPHLSPLP